MDSMEKLKQISAKHTPGPWSINNHGEIESEDGFSSIAFCSKNWLVPKEQWAANVNLIAAAPRLLAACEKTELYLVSVGVPESHAIIVELRAAIAQARGDE